jgi:hypothetical protein
MEGQGGKIDGGDTGLVGAKYIIKMLTNSLVFALLVYSCVVT